MIGEVCDARARVGGVYGALDAISGVTSGRALPSLSVPVRGPPRSSRVACLLSVTALTALARMDVRDRTRQPAELDCWRRQLRAEEALLAIVQIVA